MKKSTKQLKHLFFSYLLFAQPACKHVESDSSNLSSRRVRTSSPSSDSAVELEHLEIKLNPDLFYKQNDGTSVATRKEIEKKALELVKKNSFHVLRDDPSITTATEYQKLESYVNNEVRWQLSSEKEDPFTINIYPIVSDPSESPSTEEKWSRAILAQSKVEAIARKLLDDKVTTVENQGKAWILGVKIVSVDPNNLDPDTDEIKAMKVFDDRDITNLRMGEKLAVTDDIYASYSTDDPYWHLKKTRITLAWALVDAKIRGLPLPSSDDTWATRSSFYRDYFSFEESRISHENTRVELQRLAQNAGKGIVIGHPDTGFLKHPEIFSRDLNRIRNLAPKGTYNFLTNNADSFDAAPTQRSNNRGHGTRTASLIIAPPDLHSEHTSAIPGAGSAPGAKLMSLRISEFVVITSKTANRLASAIDYAAENGAKIISISLGGRSTKLLRQSLINACEKGVLVFAAAGNGLPLTVYPARHPEAIAVAACRADAKTWKITARDSQPLICAPGDRVWHSAPIFNSDKSRYTGHQVQQGGGTSLATAITAGAAALWYQFHGEQKLRETYGRGPDKKDLGCIGIAFEELLRQTGELGERKSLDPAFSYMKAGFLNAEALLLAPLPSSSVCS